MTTFFRLSSVGLLLGLLLSGGPALAQTGPTAEPAAPTVSQRAQRMASYLADALRLNARQAAKLRAAVEKRLDSAEMLGHLLFTSGQEASSAFENIDYRYYAAMGKVLTPTQFHLLLQLDEPVAPADAPVMVQRH
ncbi:hypothetical protein GKZ68_13160 [Hymenobacter sp. BRD128]|uniref:hypothetical protein n=1 Tax=Hymenobacter sp. BRD128 TaxID=2675878 RepID=UPI001567B05B|nr:hypothetical protein [Hymenobacter sp. BRD128]QKG57491.1 hypothetical protein GKZ68_13160 [Hymenobacter sp. BRD128]